MSQSSRLAMRSGFVPCTPLGCLRLLRETGVEISGAHVVVLGRSMIVGKPLALLLMRKGDAMPQSRSRIRATKNLAEISRSADMLIAAIGQPEFVKREHVREGAVVIDVGINRVEDPTIRAVTGWSATSISIEVAPRSPARSRLFPAASAR